MPAPGKVTFYDKETIIGIEMLTGAAATLPKVALLPGKHSLHALFQGSQGYSSSKSPAILAFSTSQPIRYFEDNFVGNVTTHAEPNIQNRVKIITADFNHDGNLDIAFNPGNGIFVALGNGNGSFRVPTEYLSSCDTNPIYDFTALDIYGSGNLDLAIIDNCDLFSFGNSLTILVGQGDGTFVEQANPETTFYSNFNITTGDFNLDGVPDLVLSGDVGGIYLNDGKGNFTAAPGTLDPLSTTVLAVADFNGDGKPDVLVEESTGIVGVQFGNGDGSLQPAIFTNPNLHDFGMPIVFDANKDGIPDLAIPTNVGVSVFLGKGDGTFGHGTSYKSLGQGVTNLAAADINSDGNVDLVLFTGGCASCYDSLALYGNGNGTFQAATELQYSNENLSGPFVLAAVGSFNNDSLIDSVIISVLADKIFSINELNGIVKP